MPVPPPERAPRDVDPRGASSAPGSDPDGAPSGGPATGRAAGRLRRAGAPLGLTVVGALLIGWWWGSQPLPDAGALAAPGERAATREVVVAPDDAAPSGGDVVTDPLRTLPYATAAPAAPAPAAPVEAPVEAPVVLRGDHLPGDVTVDPVGVADGGAMALPRDGRRVGWYRFGAAPGDTAGSAVLAGHVDTRDGGRGALADTRLLEVGDRLQVVRSDGSTVDYAVTARVRVGKEALPVDELFVRDGAPRLVLITCGGAWDPDIRHYVDNVVVTADPA